MSPLDKPVPQHWTTVEGVFILIGGVYQSHLAKDNLMAAAAKLDDGIIYLCVVKAGITRIQLAKVFTSLETGLVVLPDDPYVQIIKVKSFHLDPLTPKGLMTVDGELVDYGSIQAQILPSLARVMSLNCETFTHF